MKEMRLAGIDSMEAANHFLETPFGNAHAEKQLVQGDSGSFGCAWAGLLQRRCGSDWLQAEGNDLGADHFAGNHQFDTAILLTALGGIVRRNGSRLAKTF